MNSFREEPRTPMNTVILTLRNSINNHRYFYIREFCTIRKGQLHHCVSTQCLLPHGELPSEFLRIRESSRAGVRQPWRETIRSTRFCGSVDKSGDWATFWSLHDGIWRRNEWNSDCKLGCFPNHTQRHPCWVCFI